MDLLIERLKKDDAAWFRFMDAVTPKLKDEIRRFVSDEDQVQDLYSQVVTTFVTHIDYLAATDSAAPPSPDNS